MRILMMGTAAAEGVPSVFCACSACEYARANRGKDIRRRASVLINDELLIDLGPDLFNFAADWGMCLGGVRFAFQTHPHDDHLDGLSLFSRCDGTKVQGVADLTWYCASTSIRRADNVLFYGEPRFGTPEVQAEHHMSIVTIEPWQEVAAGPYRVQTVRANHAEGEQAMLFAIEDTQHGGRLFYGTDTGPLPADTWPRLAELGWRFDVFMLDHTMGWGPRGGGHLNQEQFLEEVGAARSCGLIDEETRIIATHFAHHGHPPHKEFVARAAQRGYEPAWDGMEIEIARS